MQQTKPLKSKLVQSDILTLTDDGSLTIAGTMNTDGDTTLSGNTDHW